MARAVQRVGTSRSEVFLSTKCPGAIGYEATIQCVDGDLQLLGQFDDEAPGHINLLFMHYANKIDPACRFRRGVANCSMAPVLSLDNATKLERQETWRAMEELKVKHGVVRSLGLSTYTASQIDDILEVAKEPIDVVSRWFTPDFHEEEMLRKCQQHGIQLQGWSLYNNNPVLNEPAIQGAATAHNVTAQQVALRWMIERGVGVVTDTTYDEVDQDLGIFDFSLTSKEVDAISALNTHIAPAGVMQ